MRDRSGYHDIKFTNPDGDNSLQATFISAIGIRSTVKKLLLRKNNCTGKNEKISFLVIVEYYDDRV